MQTIYNDQSKIIERLVSELERSSNCLNRVTAERDQLLIDLKKCSENTLSNDESRIVKLQQEVAFYKDKYQKLFDRVENNKADLNLKLQEQIQLNKTLEEQNIELQCIELDNQQFFQEQLITMNKSYKIQIKQQEEKFGNFFQGQPNMQQEINSLNNFHQNIINQYQQGIQQLAEENEVLKKKLSDQQIPINHNTRPESKSFQNFLQVMEKSVKFHRAEHLRQSIRQIDIQIVPNINNDHSYLLKVMNIIYILSNNRYRYLIQIRNITKKFILIVNIRPKFLQIYNLNSACVFDNIADLKSFELLKLLKFPKQCVKIIFQFTIFALWLNFFHYNKIILMFKHCHGPDNVFTVPLSTLQKYYESDDETDGSCCIKPKCIKIEDRQKLITFNEELVICYYKPKDPPTEVQKELEKCSNDPALSWVNPSFKKKPKQRESFLESTNH